MTGWDVRHGELGLVRDGVFGTPSADDIYRSAVECRQVWEDVEPGPAPGLSFSRYPALPRAALNAGPDGTPTLAFEAVLDSGTAVAISAQNIATGHFVSDGVWYPLEPDILNELGALLYLPTKGPLSLRSVLALKKSAANGGPVTDRFEITPSTAAVLAPAVDGDPKGVVATLYPYQRQGWQWLRLILGEGLGGLLCDEMGLGKTLQVIAAITDAPNGTISPVLIVAPGSLLENWHREISRFSPGLQVLKHHGPLRTGTPAGLRNHDVVITSYGTVYRDNSLLQMFHWALVVLDEAQNIKNPDAIRTKAVKSLRRDAGLGVTGTPVENSLADFWSLMDFACPGYLGDQASFSSKYMDDPEGAARLEPIVSPLMLRRRVAEVAKDLPARIDIPQALELSAQEAAIYDVLRQEILADYGRAANLVALTKLRMYCAHPSLVDASAGADAAAFSKMWRLMEILDEIFASGEKALVFTSYTKMADLIASEVQNRFGVFARTLDGRLPIDDRQPLLDTFHNEEGAGVLVLNPRAGGSGLNITAANHVIHYNPEWNPALEDQASARSYRRGQTRPVTIHRLFYACTVEEVVDERLQRKRALAETAVVGVAGEESDFEDIMAALERSPVVSTERHR
jgi:SNF2 family DNA or RNA helicase